MVEGLDDILSSETMSFCLWKAVSRRADHLNPVGGNLIGA